ASVIASRSGVPASRQPPRRYVRSSRSIAAWTGRAEPVSDWKDDPTLGYTARSLGENVVIMYNSCGMTIPDVYLDPRGAPSPHIDQAVVSMFVLDAEDFMSPDPQQLIDEYQRMQRVAEATGGDDGEARAALDLAQARLAANWHGEAADAFAE